MPTVVVHHAVTDADHWLTQTTRERFFGPLGITNVRTYVNPQDRSQVALTMDVPDVEALVSALQSPEAAEAMKADGVHADTVALLVES